MLWMLSAIIGLLVGHVVRRFTPALLGEKKREMPFKGPWVELIGAALFVLVYALRGVDPSQLKWYLFTTLLLAIATADAHRKYVPTGVCWTGTVLGLILVGIFPRDILDLLAQGDFIAIFGFSADAGAVPGIILSVSGALMGFLEIWFIRRLFYSLAGLEAMGLGDAYIMMMVGAWLGPQGVVFALLPACIFGIAYGMIRKALFGVSHLAFGPALAMGSLFLQLFADRVIGAIAGLNNLLYSLPPLALLAFSLFLVFLLIFLVLRMRRKSAEYAGQIEEDYKEIDEKMGQ
ncbi:MAG: A24 family peptidase [Acidobacteriota bacterium]|nr:A24 family peptidase [Acidobacteriota bacterium]